MKALDQNFYSSKTLLLNAAIIASATKEGCAAILVSPISSIISVAIGPVGLQYRSPNSFFGRVGVQGTGETFFDEENEFKQSVYAVVNARLGYELDNTGIYFFANNIFDDEYLTQGAAFLDPIGQYGTPATFGVQVNSRF